jgi:pilus assembly protein CpaC
MIKRCFALLILLSVMMIGHKAIAAVDVSQQPAKTLSVSVDRGVSLSLDQPAASVFIANPDIADVQVMSSTAIMIFGKRTGETTFMATDSGGHTLEERTIYVTEDLSSLRRDLDDAIPGNKIHTSAVPKGIILTGDAKDAATVADAQKIAMRYLPSGGDIINRIRVSGSNQISIRVRFAEVQRNIDNSLGFNWSNLANVGGFAFGVATGVAGIGSGSSILGTRPNNNDLNQPNDVIGISRTGGHYNVNAVIDALAQDGLITILAEPNLTAMSGETANFLAGGEFPITIPQGNGTISIEFKSYGISLAFTPTLINDDRISLHVKPEVSELTTVGAVTLNNNVVPALTTRRAETTVEVASGQSFAIAGLLDNSQTQTVNKYPMLGDLPILGALFRSDRFQNGQTELVIIITPYIVKPSGAQQLALPTDGLAPPSEADRYLDLRYNSSNPNARPQSGDPVAVREPAVTPDPVTPVTLAPTNNHVVKPTEVPEVTATVNTEEVPASNSVGVSQSETDPEKNVVLDPALLMPKHYKKGGNSSDESSDSDSE